MDLRLVADGRARQSGSNRRCDLWGELCLGSRLTGEVVLGPFLLVRFARFSSVGWESAGFYMESDLSDVLACCVHRCESTPLIVNHRMRVITPIPGTASV